MQRRDPMQDRFEKSKMKGPGSIINNTYTDKSEHKWSTQQKKILIQIENKIRPPTHRIKKERANATEYTIAADQTNTN